MAQITFSNVIGGELVPAASGATYDVADPATGQVYARAPMSGAEDVDRAYAAAADAFETWSTTTPKVRSEALLRIADAYEARIEEFARAEVKDTGKPYRLTLEEEMPPSADHLRFYAGAARTLGGLSTGEYLEHHTSWIRREPVGVIGQVAPWNYPLSMGIWKLAPAIAAGNTVVLKPSDTTPATTTLFAELAQELLPPGVLNVITGDRDTGRALVAHKTPQMVAITGSVQAGMEVAGAAAKDLKRVHLELGGKAPVVVFDDADLEAAAEGIAAAGFFNAGQDCTAACRVLAQEGIHDDLVAALTEKARATATGLPEDDPDYGALNNPDQLARVKGMVDRLPAHAKVETGGDVAHVRGGEGGWYYQPTIVSGLRQDDEQVQQEIFGPVITVQRFTDEKQAVTWANDVDFGLGSSVWTRDHATAVRVSNRLDFGVVWINTHIPFISEMPHGGFKHSGYGNDMSVYGLEDYTRIKHVMSYTGA
ncbi:MAG: aminobutyraldehyde dehydrogenase [Nocardioides sp.]|nr:aminobutyraldehyde dehydrogenase [Nocardioides sp.]